MSLFCELSDRVSEPPTASADRDGLLAACLGELAHRGFDQESIVRTMVGAFVGGVVLIGLLLPVEIEVPIPEGWRQLVRTDDPAERRDELVPKVFAGVDRWALTAAIEDVIAWRAPTRAEFGAPSSLPASNEASTWVSRWLWERFTRRIPR